MTDSTTPYRWCCKACGQSITANAFCAKDGAVRVSFACNDPASGNDITPQCETCRGAIDVPALPAECRCGSHNLEWRMDSGNWYSPPLDYETPEDYIWVRGNFEGNFQGTRHDGELAARLGGSHARSFDVQVNEGNLTKLTVVSNPPTRLQDQEPRPWRQDRVDPVHIPAMERGKAIPVCMDDFRLHEWDTVRRELGAGGGGHRLVGHVKGIAYARIKKSQLKTKPTISDPPEKPQPTPPEPSCKVCSWLLQLILAALAGWRCGLQTGLVDFAIMRIACWLELLAKRSPIRRQGWLNLTLIAISLIGLMLFFTMDWCNRPTLWPLALPALAVLGSAWSLSCALRMLLVILLQIAVWLSCGAGTGLCSINPNQGAMQRVEQAVQQAIHDGFGRPPAEEAREESMQTGNRPPVSLEEAIQNPDKVKDCETPIRFESRLLFDYDRSEIRPAIESDLTKLLTLLQTEQLRKERFMITGHADRAGDGSEEGKRHNKKLSTGRARIVEQWLRAHGNFAADQILAEGAGAWLPVSNDPAREYLNRRVEIRVICRSGRQ